MKIPFAISQGHRSVGVTQQREKGLTIPQNNVRTYATGVSRDTITSPMIVNSGDLDRSYFTTGR